MSGAVTQSGYCLRSLAPHFVEIFWPFDERLPVSVTIDAFAALSKVYEQKVISDESEKHETQFLDIYE